MSIQIREAAHAEERSSLVVHRDRGDGTPGCGIKAHPWENQPMLHADVVDATVTCTRNGCR
jgi:hypothetical protein